jgi:hypothetical protein
MQVDIILSNYKKKNQKTSPMQKKKIKDIFPDDSDSDSETVFILNNERFMSDYNNNKSKSNNNNNNNNTKNSNDTEGKISKNQPFIFESKKLSDDFTGSFSTSNFLLGDPKNGFEDTEFESFAFNSNNLAEEYVLDLQKVANLEKLQESYKAYVTQPIVSFTKLVQGVCGLEMNQLLETGYEDVLKLLERRTSGSSNRLTGVNKISAETLSIIKNLSDILSGKSNYEAKDSTYNNLILEKSKSLKRNSIVIDYLKTLPQVSKTLYFSADFIYGLTRGEMLCQQNGYDIDMNRLIKKFPNEFAFVVGNEIKINKLSLQHIYVNTTQYNSKINEKKLAQSYYNLFQVLDNSSVTKSTRNSRKGQINQLVSYSFIDNNRDNNNNNDGGFFINGTNIF